MASPGQFEYVLDGKSVYFINENDSRLRLTGYAPIADVDASGVVYPTTASLTLAEKAPKAIGIVSPPVGGLAITSTTPVFPQPVDPTVGSLTLSGKTPALGRSAIPDTYSVTITGQDAARWTGLWFESVAVTITHDRIATPTVGGIGLSGKIPDVIVPSPGSKAMTPETRSVSLAGQAPTVVVGNVVLPTTDALTIQGRLTNIYKVAYPSRGSARMVGYAPALSRSEGQVTVVIEGPFNYGTFIRNTNATTEPPVNYEICDRSGKKVKRGTLVRDAYGYLVLPEYADKRHPSERVSSRPEGQEGAKRPDDTKKERFIEDEYPNGVSRDDL